MAGWRAASWAEAAAAARVAGARSKVATARGRATAAGEAAVAAPTEGTQLPLALLAPLTYTPLIAPKDDMELQA